MSETNNIRPYPMPALQETPSSQLAVRRRPLPSSAPKRTAAQMDEDADQEGPRTPPRRVPRRNIRGKKPAETSRPKRAEDGKNSPTPLPAVPSEYSVATHCTNIPGYGSIYYAEDRPPLFVPATVLQTQHFPVTYACHCHEAHTAGIAQPNMPMLPIRAPGHGYGGDQGWSENTWGYVPGFELGDISQMHGSFNFNHGG
ncbi:hypothetical protein FGADI_965 [Fusarium gaditjirri]|uniref:Uncharacterized protein n=1 Tax=Fusarium gaditjirri TaxID=282569 RepID=A0A8H4X393_9HYPO|nr:hypothetical protein FGADI_965 [Fusarium gaditjirri]